MNACPGEGELRRFLDGELGALGDLWIEVHLEHCAGCRKRLEHLRGERPAGPRTTIEPAICEKCRMRFSRGRMLRRVDPLRERPVTGGQPTSTMMRAPGGITGGIARQPVSSKTRWTRPRARIRAGRSTKPRRWRGNRRPPPREVGTIASRSDPNDRAIRPGGRRWPATRSSSSSARAGWGSSTGRGTSG